MEYREITSFENMPFLFSRRKAGLLPPRPLRDLCASAWKNGDVTSWKTIPLQSDTPISPVLHEMLKTDLSPFFYSLRIHFRTVAQRFRRERGGGKGVLYVLKSDTPISSTLHEMLKNRLIAFASSARKNGDVTSCKTIPLQSDNAISFHTVRDAENRLNTSFLPLAFQFSRRVVKGVVTF